ncbi:MAG TPA: thermonuclease family protein, partial [Ornithinibacter sp.]|nr:thermonuclease family protein [Ornithinibacter sp.]
QPLDRDLALYATIGQRLGLDSLPYRDLFDHKQPLIHYVYGGLDLIAPGSLLAIRLAAAVPSALVAALLLVYLEPLAGFRRAAAAAAALVRVASVTDGDTIRVRLGGTTERVRVIGIDTPELSGDECYAQEAASRMQGLVQGRQVRLVRDPTQADRDRHGRLLRHVALADGRQVAKILIAGGFGEEYTYDEPYAGRAAYRAAEQAAREAGRGIWSSGCRARAHAAAPVAPTQCVLKGNNADDGERRWFCTERQARDAGRRASKV